MEPHTPRSITVSSYVSGAQSGWAEHRRREENAKTLFLYIDWRGWIIEETILYMYIIHGLEWIKKRYM